MHDTFQGEGIVKFIKSQVYGQIARLKRKRTPNKKQYNERKKMRKTK